ncbi:hypothetical protein K469DRAFT_637513 [Zopfia rhizophila CBS 207.26]|uniref:Uncharacterized protein n=1 Tax=Zopfia rhizophila CBS 207.26 TaxID=1314779 RepID=A0A6A6DR67_9PEZI|nr:hypothetical protein K469DRAFT_637513 [Zopfia rhizophila CBS 207.26]
METISNAASTASKMIWGEQNPQTNETAGQEPISGHQGKGTATEPFDQGNAENPTSTSSNATSTFTNPAMSSTSSNIPNNSTNSATGGQPRPEHETDKRDIVGNMSASTKASDNPGVAPSSGGVPFQKQQGADRPFDAPTGKQESAVKETKDVGEEALKKRDPSDHSGEPMKMHGVDNIPKTQEERRTSKAGNPGGQEHGKEVKGTGEQWIKTSGMAADGGDFDATKPGAGREADRLLEEKGIQKSTPGEPQPSESNSSKSDETKEKVPWGEKIKTKLHIGHKEK